MVQQNTRLRSCFRFALAAIYAFAGLAHLQWPEIFAQITPSWVPYPHLVILVTGLYEILGAIGLLTKKFRYAAGWGLALYAICVFPANIKHALDDFSAHGTAMNGWYHGPRLLFQPFFVWWALWVGGVTNRPFTNTNNWPVK
jgi:uncharacterized membrane protein